MKRNTHADWLRLDNAAKIYPATRSETWSAVFRMSAVLREAVDPEILRQSIDAAVKRFPSLYMQMRRGVFWYFLDRPPQGLAVHPQLEAEPPCQPLRDDEGVVFRVLYFNNRISVEFFHVLTDGFGALTFLKALVADYLTRCGLIRGPQEGVLSLNEDPLPREWEDSFYRYADAAARGSRSESHAWQIPGQPLRDTMVTQALMPLSAVKHAAHANQVSITEYIAGHLLSILYKHCTNDKPVKLSVPVNLRSFFPSQTLRNFSSYINITMDSQPESLAAACQSARTQLREQAQADILRNRLSLNVNSERNVLLRLAPLPLKDMTLRAAFAMYGESLFTTALSNIGGVNLPEAMREHIDYFDFILGKPYMNALAFALISFNDTMVLSITRRIRESWVERDLITALVADGIPVSLIANQEVTCHEV